MRRQDELLASRARVRMRYALLPREGIPFSRLPGWAGAQVQVLAGPALGAAFVECLIELPAGAGSDHLADGRIEHFIYVLSGAAALTMDGKKHALTDGGYALISPASHFAMTAKKTSRLLLLRKVYEPAANVALFESLIGRQQDVKGTAYSGDQGALLQRLIPDDLSYDLAMNIFTFQPGHSLPVTETHVMEHGLYVLEGKGVYYLDDRWMEVEATDFIWMGPFCPQSYHATGPVPTRYLYYKNVNREIAL